LVTRDGYTRQRCQTVFGVEGRFREIVKLRDKSRGVVRNQVGGIGSLLPRCPLCASALVGAVMLHAVILTAEPRTAAGFRALVVLFAGVDAGVACQMPRGRERFAAVASVFAG